MKKRFSKVLVELASEVAIRWRRLQPIAPMLLFDNGDRVVSFPLQFSFRHVLREVNQAPDALVSFDCNIFTTTPLFMNSPLGDVVCIAYSCGY